MGNACRDRQRASARTAALVGLPEELLQRYPHQLVRRATRARRHRARDCGRALAADPRRAYFGARCVGSGRDPAAARRSQRPAGDELSVRVARPQRGAASVFARRRHVSRQDRRDRAGRGALHRARVIPIRQALVAAIPDPARRGEAAPAARRQSDEPDRSGSERLPLLRPLPEERRSLHQGHAAAARQSARTISPPATSLFHQLEESHEH